MSRSGAYVKSGTQKSLPPSFMCPISAPQAGFELASALSVEERFIQLSYWGELDDYTNRYLIISQH